MCFVELRSCNAIRYGNWKLHFTILKGNIALPPRRSLLVIGPDHDFAWETWSAPVFLEKLRRVPVLEKIENHLMLGGCWKKICARVSAASVRG